MRLQSGSTRKINLMVAVVFSAMFFLSGCAKSDDLTSDDYAKADAILEQRSQLTYPPTAKADGTPFQIAYVDIDPYPPSGEMLYYFIHELIKKGWIELGEALPFSPLDTDAKEMLHYLSVNDTAGYLQFSDDTTYYLAIDGEDACRESLEQKLKNQRIDLIFCMGTWPGTFIKDMEIEEIPVMVYFSVDPVTSGIAQSAEDSGLDNLWCHINDNVYYKQLEFYHENFEFQNIGMVYYDESVAAMRAYRDVADTVGFQITEVKVNQLTDKGAEAETQYYDNLKNTFQTLILDSHIDAFLLSTDILKDESRIEEMLQPFYQHKIPVVVQNGEYFVQQGALMMVTASDAKEQAPFVTDTLAGILHGTPPREMQQEYLSPPYLSINVGAAEALGYRIPYDLIISAEHIYE